MAMVRRGESNLNPIPAQAHWDSVKEGLKQAMLQHEIVFRNQVCELHRVYWTQKNLMNEVCWKHDGPTSAHKAAEECNGYAEERRFYGLQSPLPMPQSNSVEFYVDGQRNFNLQLPVNGFSRGTMLGSSCHRNAEGVESLRVDCSTIETSWGQNCRNSSYLIDLEAPLEMKANKIGSPVCSLAFNTPADNGADMSSSQVRVLFDTLPAGRMQSDLRHVSAQEHFYAGHQRQKCLPQTSFHSYSVVREFNGSKSVNPPIQKHQSTSKRLDIDLNLAQDDEAINMFPDPVNTYSSPSTSQLVDLSGDLWRELRSKYPNGSEPSSICRKETKIVLPEVRSHDLEILLPALCNNNQPSMRQSSKRSTKDNEISLSGIENSVKFCRRPTDRCSTASNEVTQNRKNVRAISRLDLNKPEDENADLLSGEKQVFACRFSKSCTSNAASGNEMEDICLPASAGSNDLLQSTVEHPGEEQTKNEDSEEDTVSSCAIASYEERRVEVNNLTQCNKLGQFSGNDKFMSEKKVSTKLVTVPPSNNSGIKVQSLDSETLCCKQISVLEAYDARLTDKSCTTEKQQTEAVELDLLITKAAETIVSFSVDYYAFPHLFTVNGEMELQSKGQMEFENEQGNDQSQFSADSFEQITLKLEEIKDDGTSATFCNIEKETGKESCHLNQRRRRGLRDFKKDVLPGLVSLSRHEICEDMHTLKYDLRSNRSRKAFEENWLMPVRNRRSRRNVCRKS